MLWQETRAFQAGLCYIVRSCLKQNKTKTARCWSCMSLIPALRRQRQADLCEFEVRLVYKS